MGLAVASWEQQLGEESSNWEQRTQPVLTGRGLLGGTAATQCLAVDQAGRASRGDVLLLLLCFLQHPTGLALLLATRCEQGRKTKSWAQMPNIILFAGCDRLGEPCPVQCPLQSQKRSIILTLSASLLMEVTLMGTGTGGRSGHGSGLGPEAVLGKCSPPQCGSSPQIQRKRCTVSLSCHLWPH